MKKLFFIITFLLFFTGITMLIAPENDSNSKNPIKEVVKNKPSKKQPLAIEPEVKTGSQVYYSLWEEQSKDISMLPENIDNVYNNGKANIYQNFYHGYEVNYPLAWKIDNHLSQHYTRFYDKTFRLDVTVQDVRDAWTNSSTFMENTLEYVTPYVSMDKSWNENGYTFRTVEYSRKPLNAFKDDFTQYYYGFIIDGNIVYTFHLKTKENHSTLMEVELANIMESFKTINKKEVDLTSEISKKTFNPAIKEQFENGSLEIPQNSFMMGVHTPVSSDVNTLDQTLNTHFGNQLFYKPLDSNFDDYFKHTQKEKRLPIITFLFETSNHENEENKEILQRIIDGEFDANITSWAKGTKQMKSPIVFRLGNEMNGAWSDWSHVYAYNDTDLYKLAYRHIVDVFKVEDVPNAFFSWNPNENSDPYYAWNHASMYYPGDKYVDWVGMTAYNFGKTKWGDFRYFDTLYSNIYEDYLVSYSSKPFMIGELGSVETGGNKGKFIEEMFTKIPTDYPNVKMALWFNEVHAPYDFKITTSTSSEEAFKRGMSNDNIVKSLK